MADYVLKFKTGNYYLMDNGHILEVIDDSYNLPFIRVKQLGVNGETKIHQNILERILIKDLGNNSNAVRILLGKRE